MRSAIRAIVYPAAAAALLACALAAWWGMGTRVYLPQRLSGADGASTATAPVAPNLHGTLTAGTGSPSALKGQWPGFRGAGHDGIAADPADLARQWPAGGPPKLWQVDLGEGYAGAAVRDGRVYVVDYDQATQADAIRCLSLEDGAEIWRYSYPVKIKRNHGMSRTTPAVSDKYVVTLGPKCHVTCLDAATGQLVWGLDLVAQYGSAVPEWYAGQCPLIDGERVILAPAGPQVLMLAVNLADGQVVWQCPNPMGWKMSHASVLPAELAGRKQYVYPAAGGVVGVSTDGKLLWQSDEWKIKIATVPSACLMGNDKIFLSGGYNAGAMIMQIVPSGETQEAKVLAKLKPSVFGSEQQTPLFRDGRVYGLREDGQLVCLDGQGKVVWTSGKQGKFDKGGPYLLAGDLMYVLNDSGRLSLLEIGPSGPKLLGEADVLSDGHDAWGPMALVDGRLILRDLKRMVCLDLRQGAK